MAGDVYYCREGSKPRKRREHIRYWIFLILVCLIALPAAAQGGEVLRQELAIGGSFLEAIDLFLPGAAGVDLSYAWNFNNPLALKAHFAFHNTGPDDPGLFSGPGFTNTQVMAGPRASARFRWVTPSIHFLVGANHFDPDTPFTSSHTSFVWLLGFGLDVNLTERVSIRALQIDYFDGQQQAGVEGIPSAVRITFGVVIRWGERD